MELDKINVFDSKIISPTNDKICKVIKKYNIETVDDFIHVDPNDISFKSTWETFAEFKGTQHLLMMKYGLISEPNFSWKPNQRHNYSMLEKKANGLRHMFGTAGSDIMNEEWSDLILLGFSAYERGVIKEYMMHDDVTLIDCLKSLRGSFVLPQEEKTKTDSRDIAFFNKLSLITNYYDKVKSEEKEKTPKETLESLSAELSELVSESAELTRKINEVNMKIQALSNQQIGGIKR